MQIYFYNMRNTKTKYNIKYLDNSFLYIRSANLDTHLKQIEIQNSRKMI